MRDRLIELLSEAEDLPMCLTYEGFADYLLENGVVCPPCKVGDKVYEVIPKGDCIRSLNVVGFHLGRFPDLRGHKRKEYLVCYSNYSLIHLDIDKFGKTVFLTREEAEAKLKEGVQG